MPDINVINEILVRFYPYAECSLDYAGDPWRLLVAGRLSAQCTDEKVNKVCETLFEEYSDVYEFAEADVEDIEDIIRPCGLYHTKAQSICEAAKIIVSKHFGLVPGRMEDLLELPGIGRKIANLVLGDCFDVPGIVADTHCIRINGRLGFYPATLKDPLKVERILSGIVPLEEQSDYCHRMVLFGREYCTARSPKCAGCPLREYCEFENKNL